MLIPIGPAFPAVRSRSVITGYPWQRPPCTRPTSSSVWSSIPGAILDQCFVTRRDVYWECGGLREELGHFAEWVLAAAYHARGHSIGYLEEARFHHYYVGEIDELKKFTLDFVQGEIRYLGEARSDPGSELLDVPIEWSSRSEAGTSLARNALNALLRSSLAGGGGRPGEKLLALWRW